MKWLDKLEKKYHKYAIPNLMQYIVAGMAIVFVFQLMNRDMEQFLYFSPLYIMQGQIWRLLTFLVLPLTNSIIWFIFSLLFAYFVGSSLEHYWGTFRFNVYYFIGVFGTMLSAIIMTLATGYDYQVGNYYIHTTMFLALATVAPNYEIRIYMILPVKLKYLGYITAAGLVLNLGSSLFVGNYASVLALLISVANYLVFFGPGLLNKRKQDYRRAQFKQSHKPTGKTKAKRPMPKSGKGEVIQVAFHCCEVCGKTEVDDPNLEFRYCSKCEGRHEYCSEHILSHEHVNENHD